MGADHASEMLKNYNLFLGEDIKWHRASDIYLDTPFGDTGLSDYYSITGQSKDGTPLAAFYQDLLKDTQELVRFAEALGAKKYIDFRKVSCMGNPEWKYLRDAARGERITSSIDDDFRIDNFDTLVSAKSIRIANLIWDSLSYRTTSSKNWQNILRATYQKTRSGGPVYSHSQVVHKLKEAAWVTQGNRFVCPADARAELLPNGFMFDPSWQWIKEIEFGKNIEQKIERERAAEEEFVEIKKRRYAAALELGFKADDDLLWLEKAAAIPPDQILRMFDEWNASQIKSTFPQHEPRNPERRADKVGAMAAEAPFKRTEERQRSVPVGRSDVKTETTQYLINQYKIEADVVCQICKKPMPFKLDNGDPYFEKVEFLPELIRHHPQNYLALCPNDAAMFMYANGSKKLLLGKLNFISGEKIDVLLARKNETIFFTKTHIADLKKVIEVDGVIAPMA